MQFLGTSHVSRSVHTRRLRVEPLEDRRMLAVFSVDNLNDAGLGSLRQAIDDANALVGADTVEFQAGLSGTMALTSGEMTITDDLTIDGPGAAQLTIDAQQASRIFHVTPTSGPVTFEGLHLTGGDAAGSGGAIFSETSGLLAIQSSTISGNSTIGGFVRYGGGGIFAHGNVTITDSTISGNSASSGGGIFADGGDVTITNSTISGNSATFSTIYGGGGIFAVGNVTVTASTISDNSAKVDGRRVGGGGIAAFNGDVTITGSTISGNSTTSSAGGGYGGGIFTDSGDVTITSSTISGNSANNGGGIFAGGDVTITSSAISGNSADDDGVGFGGGIFAPGDVTVTGSTISDNSANSKFDIAFGGGIAAGDVVTVTNSTISGNSANSNIDFAYGGGIIAFDVVTVTNSTISSNSATGVKFGAGGGIAAFDDVTVTDSTISGNSVPGANSSGGGIWIEDDPVTIENSIVAGNHADSGTSPDLSPGSGPLTIRYSLIGDNTGTGLAPAPVGMPDANGNLIGTAASPIDPMLGPLQDNGGPTFTHALLPGSPAINAGDPGFVPPPDFDQRGDPFVRVLDGRIDMGAFERQPVTLDERIEHLLDTGVLNRGQANSLLVKLNPGGNERAQLNRLWAFINEINALVRAGILSAAEGQKLIDGAESLRMSLSVDAVLPTIGRRV